LINSIKFVYTSYKAGTSRIRKRIKSYENKEAQNKIYLSTKEFEYPGKSRIISFVDRNILRQQ